MEENPKELAEMTSDYYQDDPQLGDIVFMKHNFEDVTLRAPVTAIKRYHPHRGLDADGNYEVVIYTRLKIKVAGVKDWLLLDDSNQGWEITDTLSGADYNKLEPTVVAESLLDEIEDED